MTRARNQQIDAAATPYYHCISRCVRRAFLCGEDSLTGKSYEHRKAWVVERLADLSEAFAIDVCAFAIMSSHHHTVLRINEEQAAGLDDQAVMERWAKLYSLPLLVERYRCDQLDTEAEREKAREIIATWRGRLCDISWFMRGLNEHLARRANEEDGCKGRFWEGRFKSQALLDEAAVLTCLSYVDLNPVRAGIADTPEESDFTSIQQRIRELTDRPSSSPDTDPEPPYEAPPRLRLATLSPTEADLHPNAFGFTLTDYLELVDWTGRAIRQDKRGCHRHPGPAHSDAARLGPGAFSDAYRRSDPHRKTDHARPCGPHQTSGPRTGTAIRQGHGRSETTLPADGFRITATTWNRSSPIISGEAEAWWRSRRSQCQMKPI